MFGGGRQIAADGAELTGAGEAAGTGAARRTGDLHRRRVKDLAAFACDVRETGDEEGNRLKRIVRRGSGSVVTWRRVADRQVGVVAVYRVQGLAGPFAGPWPHLSPSYSDPWLQPRLPPLNVTSVT